MIFGANGSHLLYFNIFHRRLYSSPPFPAVLTLWKLGVRRRFLCVLWSIYSSAKHAYRAKIRFFRIFFFLDIVWLLEFSKSNALMHFLLSATETLYPCLLFTCFSWLSFHPSFFLTNKIRQMLTVRSMLPNHKLSGTQGTGTPLGRYKREKINVPRAKKNKWFDLISWAQQNWYYWVCLVIYPL